MSSHKNVTMIDGTIHAKCQLCGKEAELRPYGPGGKSICFECGMKDEPEAMRQFAAILKKGPVIIK